MNQEQISLIVAQAVAAAMNGGKMPRKSRSDKGFTKAAVKDAQTTDERKAAFAAATVKAFEKAGFKDIQPKVNVLTYGKAAKDDKPATGWLGQGRKVKAGEKSIHVKAPGMSGKGLPLFHISQTEEIATVQ